MPKIDWVAVGRQRRGEIPRGNLTEPEMIGRLVEKLGRIADELDIIGANDMGMISAKLAARFHNVTMKLHGIENEIATVEYQKAKER